MLQLIEEDDFLDLPAEANHAWIILQRKARERLLSNLETMDGDDAKQLRMHYITVVNQLGEDFGVDVKVPAEPNIFSKFDGFELNVARAQTRIWAGSRATYPFGVVKLPESAKSAILAHTHAIELQIDALDASEKRRKALYKKLEDFRKEINQPRTSISAALSNLAQVSTVVAMTTATIAQADDAYATILRILGAEQASAHGSETLLIEAEKVELLAPPPKRIEDKSGNQQ